METLVVVKEARERMLQQLEQEKNEQERQRLERALKDQTEMLNQKTGDLLEQNKTLFDQMGIPELSMDETTMRAINNDYETMEEENRILNRPQQNLWTQSNQHSDLLSLSAEDMKTYRSICESYDTQMITYKEAERPIPFELVVLDRIANYDYPEKISDIHTLTQMRHGDENVTKIINQEDWPQLYVGMNLKVAQYLPQDVKMELSKEWLEAKQLEITDAYAVLSENGYQPTEKERAIYNQKVHFIGDNQKWTDAFVDSRMWGFHDQAVLLDRTAHFYGSQTEEAFYKEQLRNHMIERYAVGSGLSNQTEMEKILSKASNFEQDCTLKRSQAMQLYLQGITVKDGLSTVDSLESMMDINKYHEFTCNRQELESKRYEMIYQNQQIHNESQMSENVIGETLTIKETGFQEVNSGEESETHKDVVYSVGKDDGSDEKYIEEETIVEETVIEEDIDITRGLHL